MSDARKHARNATRLLEHADDMVEADDLLQASEKIWGTVAHTLKQIAEKHGWRNESFTDLAQIADYLAAVTGDREINEQYQRARGFHTNFYEDEFTLRQIAPGVAMADDLVERLRTADRQVAQGVLPPGGAKSPGAYVLQTKATDMNRDIAALRKQGLSSTEATVAAQILQRARSRRANVLGVSFTIGADRRRVTVGKDGQPRVSKPRSKRQGSREQGLKKSGMASLPGVVVRRR